MTIEELHEYKCWDMKGHSSVAFLLGMIFRGALRLCRRGGIHLVLHVGNLLSALAGREVQ